MVQNHEAQTGLLTPVEILPVCLTQILFTVINIISFYDFSFFFVEWME